MSELAKQLMCLAGHRRSDHVLGQGCKEKLYKRVGPNSYAPSGALCHEKVIRDPGTKRFRRLSGLAAWRYLRSLPPAIPEPEKVAEKPLVRGSRSGPGQAKRRRADREYQRRRYEQKKLDSS